MGDAGDAPPAEAPPETPAVAASAEPSGDANKPSAVPVFTLEYPPLWVRGARLQGPNPRLLAQLTAATVALMTFAYLYVGVSWNPGARLRTLRVAVLSCDAGVPPALAPALPPAVAAAPPMGAALLASSVLDPSSAAGRTLGWEAFACAAAGGSACGATAAPACRAELQRAVERGLVWSALYISPSFTSDVLSGAPALAAAMGRNATTATIEHMYASGRSPSTYTFINAVVGATAAGLAQALGRSVLGSGALSAAFGKSFFLSPLQLVSTNLHPVVHYGQNFASYVFCVLLWCVL